MKMEQNEFILQIKDLSVSQEEKKLFSDFSLNQIKSIPFKDLTENKIKIDVADLPKGIYYLHLTGGEQNYSEKFRLQID